MTELSTPPDTAASERCLQQGLAASRADRVDEALALFQEAARLAPSSGLPYFLIGAELAELGRMDEAESSYANAVLLAPELDMARYQLGLVQFTSGRAALALVTWGPLFQQSAQSALQRVVHGFAALAQGDFATATACFREGMALNLDNPALNRDLQMLLNRISIHVQADSPGMALAPAASVPQRDERLASSPAAEESNESGLHVLLSNYRQQGPAH